MTDYNSYVHLAKELLQSGLSNPDWAVRFAAAEIFASLGSSQGLSEILKAFDEDHPASIKDRAIMAMGQLKDTSLSLYFKRAVQDRDYRVRGHAIESFSLACGKAAIKSIQKCLFDSNYFVQNCAVVALSFLPQDAAHPILESVVWDKDRLYMLRLSAAYYLGRGDSPKGYQFLYEMLRQQDMGIAFMAAQNLANLGDRAGIPHLKKMAQYGGWNEKVSAIEAMLKLGIEEEIATTLYRPSEIPDELTKLEVIRLLDHFSPQNTFNLLRNSFLSDDENMKIRVLQILGELKKTELFFLAKTVSDIGPEHLRAYLISSIEQANSEELLPLLRPILEKSHFLVRFQAAKAVLKITNTKIQ